MYHSLRELLINRRKIGFGPCSYTALQVYALFALFYPEVHTAARELMQTGGDRLCEHSQ